MNTKRKRINTTIQKIVAQSDGFSDKELLETCEAECMLPGKKRRRIIFGEGGILDPVSYRRTHPPPPRSGPLLAKNLRCLLDGYDWKKELRNVIEEEYVDSIVADVVGKMTENDGIISMGDNYFWDELDDRARDTLKVLVDKIMDAVDTVIL